MPYSPWQPSSTTCTDSPFGMLSTNFLYSTVTWIQITHHLNFEINIGEIPNITVCHYPVHLTMQARTDRIKKNHSTVLKQSSDAGSGSDRNVNSVTRTSSTPWHFLIASHTRVNAMHSKATIMHSACIKMLLAHVCLPTQIPKSQNYSSFWYSTSISRKAVKSLIGKSQLFLSFWRSTSISCERVEMDYSESQFYLSFWRSTSISCERVEMDYS